MKRITRVPLSRFEEIAPVVLECFPDFWSARFAKGERSFPYDLKLFKLKERNRIIGTVGFHDYSFLLEKNTVIETGGVCDLGVVPDMRRQGCAGMMQDFIIETILHHEKFPMIPLYTDKPAVYRKRGWLEYRPDSTRSIRTKDFPMRGVSRIRDRKLVLKIRRIYNGGKIFPGKVLRSSKTWLELFSDPAYQWRIENDTYFLYCKDRLIEAYSLDQTHPVNQFTPVNGDFDHNCIMLNLLSGDRKIRKYLRCRTLQFPAADTF